MKCIKCDKCGNVEPLMGSDQCKIDISKNGKSTTRDLCNSCHEELLIFLGIMKEKKEND